MHVFVGTDAYLRGRQTEVIMGRFKGVSVERGEERLMVVLWLVRKGEDVPLIHQKLVGN